MSKCHSRLGRYIGFLFAVFFMTALISAPADASGTMLVRVGIFEYRGFYGTDESGNPYGYGYEFYDALARHSGFKYEYKYGSWAECVEMLKNGEIDMLNNAQWSEERATLYAFSKYPAGMSFGKIFVKADESKIAYNDFNAMNNMRVGLLNGSSRNAYFKEFCKKNGFETKDVLYDTEKELTTALQNGDVNAVVTSNLRIGENERPIARFNPTPFYIMLDKNNTALHEALNDAMEQMLIENPNFIASLNIKYYPDDDGVLILTQREQEYLEEMDTLRVVYDEHWPPFESVDKTTGQPHGLNVDIFKMIAKKIGLKYEFLHGYNYAQELAAVGEKSADLLISFDGGHAKAAEYNLILTDTFFSAPIAIVGKGYRILPESVFALPKTYSMPTGFADWHFPSNKLIEFDSMSGCYAAIMNGEADFTLENIYIATDIIQSNTYDGLVIVLLTSQTDNFSMALRSDADPMLINILNKAIMTLNQSDINSILLTYTTNRAATSGLQLAENYRQRVTVVVSIAGVFVILALLVVIFMQLKNRKKLYNLAYIDPLTGVSNFNKFKIDAQKLLTQKSDERYMFAKFDVDRFKIFNEMFGYAVGDKLLKSISGSLNSLYPARIKAFARISADEFILVLAFDNMIVDDEERLGFEKRVRAQMNMSCDISFDYGRYVTAAEDFDFPGVYEKVNFAHKTAKADRLSNVCDYDERTKNAMLRKKEIENSMSAALENEEFLLYLQPKLDLKSGSVGGAEALVRWQSSDGKTVVYPGSFIPIFEENGFITKLDMYMFEKVCKLISELDDKERITISVNFSRLHFANENFVEELCAICDRYSVPHNLLEIEITETILSDNEASLDGALRKLRDTGFIISMDDFGSGYSSLGLLKNLPVDVIKFDQSFFANAENNSKSLSVLTYMIEMVKAMGMHTIAEGVETREDMELLTGLGCDMMQGYYFAKPMPKDEFVSRYFSDDS